MSEKSHKPPKSVQNNAKRGLELRRRYKRGGLSGGEAGKQGIGSGVQRASDLSNGESISTGTVKRMAAFFSRHGKNRAPGKKESDGGPTAGQIAWLLWGGDAGRTWAEGIVNRLEKNDEGSASTEGSTTFSARTNETLEEKAKKHNLAVEDDPAKRTTAAALKKVYRRGAGAWDTSHRRGIGRQQWSMARVNAFLHLLRNGSPKNSKYVQDNDLLPKGHPRAGKVEKSLEVEITKVDDRLGIVFGYAIVCKQGGEEYFDVQGDHITEEAMLKATSKYMAGFRIAKDMHVGGTVGQVVFGFPMTGEIAKSLGIQVEKTGFIVGMKPDSDDMLQKFADGTYTGFSIGGKRVKQEPADG